MVSEAKDVNAYMKEVPESRKEALSKFRKLCREILVGYDEIMAYKMPAYTRDNAVEIGFASQKNFIAFYVAIHEVMLSNEDLLKGLNHGKGCIRYANPNKIDFVIIKKLLNDTLNSKDAPC